jgi:hypothetical protein
MKIFYIGVIICLVGLVGFLLERFHVLLLILFMEIFFLGSYILIKNLVESNFLTIRGLIFYLLMGVVEGVLALSLLVGYFRISGVDYRLVNLHE